MARSHPTLVDLPASRAASEAAAPLLPEDETPALRAALHAMQQKLAATEEELDHTRHAMELARDAAGRALSHFSHELRTPLSAIGLWTSLIGDDPAQDREQLRAALSAITQSAQELQVLIEEYVDTSRLLGGHQPLDCKDIDVAAVVRSSLAHVTPLTREKNLRLDEEWGPLPPALHADGRWLQQAFGHLLVDAVKHTPAGGTLTLAMRSSADEVHLALTDTGTPIAPGWLPHVFGQRGPAGSKPDRLARGRGFGLAVAGQIIALHGGRIVAENGPGGAGVRFTVNLPLRTSAATRPSLAGRRVLFLAAPSAQRQQLAAALTAAGAVLDLADSADIAASAFARHPASLIVAELGHDDAAARAFLTEIRDREAARHAPCVPAVALADDTGVDQVDETLACGFQTCLPHAVAPDVLVETLASLARA